MQKSIQLEMRGIILMRDLLNTPKYICYLSFAKVDTLYSQLSDYEFNNIRTTKTTKVKTGMEATGSILKKLLNAELSYGNNRQREETIEGRKNHIQKLSKILSHYNQNNDIVDLRKAIKCGRVEHTPTLYYLKAEFTCEQHAGMIPETARTEQVEAEQYEMYNGKLLTRSAMATIVTSIHDYKIELYCSMKYFSDMGAHRICVGESMSDDDVWEITPHSGNRFFFDGKANATFQSVIILNGQKGKTLFGSPLVLINAFTPNLAL